MAGSKKLLGARAEISDTCGAARAARDGRVLRILKTTRTETNVTGLDHVLSMLEGPELTERRLGELALVRLMVTGIEMILYTGESDLDIRIENAKDMIREFERTYPEAREI